ncbi:MAG: hypothetical protein D6685_14625 [Bacteroidetes bacterium]|nr:hypothetical protein AWN76_001595 [Rhodothermaceae bacterium RA]RMH54629.1 MAG: hypothetical protein D6685_14625 [Bacteroidota bacterium]
MASKTAPTPGEVFAFIALCLLIGFPIVGYLWETINQLLSLRVTGTRLLISLPLLAAFIGLLLWMARRLQRWQT